MKQDETKVTKTRHQTTHTDLEHYSRKRIEGSPHNSEEEMAKALLMAKGRVTHAARLLDVSHAAVIKRIKNSEFLQMIREMAIEERLDNAEEALDSLIEKENLGAIQFLLSTIGKDRGYVRREERSTTVQGGVVLIPGGMQAENWTEMALEYRKRQETERDKTMNKLLQKLENHSQNTDSVYDAEFSTANDEDIDQLEEDEITTILDEEPEEDMEEWLTNIPDNPTPTQKRKFPKPKHRSTNPKQKPNTAGIQFPKEVVHGADGFKPDTYEEE